MNKKNVLLTGGAGFIGSNLIRYLKIKKDIGNIYVIDNLSSGKKEYLPNYVKFIKGDILDFKLMKSITKNIDIIIHLAAESGVPISMSDPMKSVTVNIMGTENILEASRINNVEKIIFASSGSVTGNELPPIHEEMKINPISPYGAGKASAEHLCNSYFEAFGLNTTIFRFSNVYGNFSFHKHGNLIPEFIKSFSENKPFFIYGDGEQSRDMIYINDLVKAIYKCISIPKSKGETFQLATNEEITINNIVNIMNTIFNKIFNKHVVIKYLSARNGDVYKSYANIDKIKSYLNWTPEYNFKTGFENLIKSINL